MFEFPPRDINLIITQMRFYLIRLVLADDGQTVKAQTLFINPPDIARCLYNMNVFYACCVYLYSIMKLLFSPCIILCYCIVLSVDGIFDFCSKINL